MTWRVPSASELRDRISVSRKDQTSDGMGGFTDAWSVLIADEAAKIDPVRGGEDVRAKRLSGVGQYDVTLRANSATLAITTADKLTDDRTGDTFDVLWIGSLDARRRFLTLTCERGGVQDG